MALELTDVSYTYAFGTPMQQPALEGVSLVVERGNVVLVAGATGSGKSTLLRLASGLLLPQSGSMSLDGAPIAGIVAGERGGVGLAFQSPEAQLFAETVLDDVAFGPRNQGLSHQDADARARDALARVGLEPQLFSDRSPFGLSGGEARRAALAGVLALEPAYLLLDEPTAGLDADGRDAVLALIGEARRSAGVVVVSHDLEIFLPVADRVLLLAAGRPSFSGSAITLLDEPSHLVRAGLSVPPVLQVLAAARERGARIERMSLDPTEACRILLEARGGCA